MGLFLIIITLLLSSFGYGMAPVHKAITREEMLETLKGRYNYASFDCAARVLSTNKGCKSPSAILQSHKDSYLLNLCGYADKHVILELCQDIRIDTLVIANFEYFSSMVRTFRVSVSKRYPAVEWREVGSFTADNGRREQIFLITDSTMYSRYLRVDFDTHYGNEYYCLVSVVRIYGKTMMEDFEESASTLPEHKPPIPIHAQVSTIKATIVTAPPPPPSKTVNDDYYYSSLTSESIPDEKDGSEFEIAMNDFLRLVREQQHRFCKATAIPKIDNGDNSDDSKPPPSPIILPQENIFKAIYDRLQDLERNVTRNTRNLQRELYKVTNDLRYVQEEVGILETKEPTNNSNRTKSKGEKKSFRVRLLHHLEKKTLDYLDKVTIRVENITSEAETDQRLMFWIAIFCLLQITALICVVSAGFSLGWFQNSKDSWEEDERRAMKRRCPIEYRRPIERSPMGRHHPHRRAQSESSLSGAMALSVNNSPTEKTDEQLVPMVSSSLEELPRTLSPAKSDLIASASRPLLLDESEAELIDATYDAASSRSSLSTPKQ